MPCATADGVDAQNFRELQSAALDVFRHVAQPAQGKAVKSLLSVK